MGKVDSVCFGGFSLCGLLGIAFVVMKLCGVIGWSWWWVTAPLWVPVAFALAVFIFAFIVISADGSEGFE